MGNNDGMTALISGERHRPIESFVVGLRSDVEPQDSALIDQCLEIFDNRLRRGGKDMLGRIFSRQNDPFTNFDVLVAFFSLCASSQDENLLHRTPLRRKNIENRRTDFVPEHRPFERLAICTRLPRANDEATTYLLCIHFHYSSRTWANPDNSSKIISCQQATPYRCMIQ